MKKILKQTWKTIRYNIRSLLIFEAGYRAATFFLVMQLVRFFVDFSLKQQGFSYLTAENYKEFLQYPLSVVFLALVFLVILIFTLLRWQPYCVVLCILQRKRSCMREIFLFWE